MSRIFVTSDTHFNHKKLIEWGRPEKFEQYILDNHSGLEPDDYLIHLGDFCIGKDAEAHEEWLMYVDHVKNKILVRGNHDKKSNGWYLSHGWDAIADQLVLRLFGIKVVFSHIPVDPALWKATEVNVHGHTHGNSHRDIDVRDYYDKDYHREVAMELTNYKPILVTDKFLAKPNPREVK
jgi:calcineurin-like phosphoesterase family protein